MLMCNQVWGTSKLGWSLSSLVSWGSCDAVLNSFHEDFTLQRQRKKTHPEIHFVRLKPKSQKIFEIYLWIFLFALHKIAILPLIFFFWVDRPYNNLVNALYFLWLENWNKENFLLFILKLWWTPFMKKLGSESPVRKSKH